MGMHDPPMHNPMHGAMDDGNTGDATDMANGGTVDADEAQEETAFHAMGMTDADIVALEA